MSWCPIECLILFVVFLPFFLYFFLSSCLVLGTRRLFELLINSEVGQGHATVCPLNYRDTK